jgi:hypothetical protein
MSTPLHKNRSLNILRNISKVHNSTNYNYNYTQLNYNYSTTQLFSSIVITKYDVFPQPFTPPLGLAKQFRAARHGLQKAPGGVTHDFAVAWASSESKSHDLVSIHTTIICTLRCCQCSGRVSC